MSPLLFVALITPHRPHQRALDVSTLCPSTTIPSYPSPGSSSSLNPMSTNNLVYMPATVSNSYTTTQPRVRKEGFVVPSTNGPTRSAPTFAPTKGQSPAKPSLSSPHLASSDSARLASSQWPTNINLTGLNPSNGSSAFSHLRQYANQSASSSATTSSASSYHQSSSFLNHFSPSTSNDIHDALASLVAFNESEELPIQSLASTRNNHSDSTATIRGLVESGGRGRRPFPTFEEHELAHSAPTPLAIAIHGQGSGAEYSDAPLIGHHSYSDAYQSLFLDHSLSEHNRQPLSPGTDLSSAFSQSQSSSLSYFDQTPYAFRHDASSQSYLDSNGAISPATSLSASFANHASLGSFSPSSYNLAPGRCPDRSSAARSSARSRSRSSVRNAASAGGPGKAPSSISRAARKGSVGREGGSTNSNASGVRGRRMSGGAGPGSSSGGSGEGAISISLPSQLVDPNHFGSSAPLPALAPETSTTTAGPTSWFFSPPSAERERSLPLTEEDDVKPDGLLDDEGNASMANVEEEEGEEEDDIVELDKAALAAEKRRRRRESHNIVERRRRDTINENITELSNLIPMCILDPRGSAEDARTIPLGLLSEKLGVDMGVLLGAGSDEDEKPLVSATATGKTKKGTTRKPKTARVSASGANALGPDGKPNKGLVLSKSVAYIKYLQQIIQAQADRNATLEDTLESLLISHTASTNNDLGVRTSLPPASTSFQHQHQHPPSAVRMSHVLASRPIRAQVSKQQPLPATESQSGSSGSGGSSSSSPSLFMPDMIKYETAQSSPGTIDERYMVGGGVMDC